MSVDRLDVVLNAEKLEKVYCFKTMAWLIGITKVFSWKRVLRSWVLKWLRMEEVEGLWFIEWREEGGYKTGEQSNKC